MSVGQDAYDRLGEAGVAMNELWVAAKQAGNPPGTEQIRQMVGGLATISEKWTEEKERWAPPSS